MDIRIVNNSDVLSCKGLYGELVLQVQQDINKIGPFYSKKYFIFNIGLNERYEILSSTRKYDFIEIVDCDADSKNLYFISAKEIKNKGKININLIRYSIISGNSKIIYSFDDNYSLLDNERKIKIFILDETHIILQNEYLKEDESGNVLGFHDFELSFIDITNGKSKGVSDKSIRESGINTIIPVKGRLCLLKTGYSQLVDSRYDLIKDAERPEEHLAMININQFVADLILNKEEVYCEPIERFQKNCTFPYIIKRDNFIIYSRVNIETHLETIVYYNILDSTVKTYAHKEVYRSAELLNPCVLDEEAYFIEKRDGIYYFRNGKTGNVNFQLENCSLKNIINGLIITEKQVPKSLFKRAHTCIEIYKDMSPDPVIREKGVYVSAVSTALDNIFIFSKE